MATTLVTVGDGGRAGKPRRSGRARLRSDANHRRPRSRRRARGWRPWGSQRARAAAPGTGARPGGRSRVRGGDLLQHAAAGRARAGESPPGRTGCRRPRRRRAPHTRGHGVLDRALVQVVEDLVAGEAALAGDLPGLIEVGHVEVAHAPGEDLPRAAELLEGGERVLERVRAAPVQEVAVQPVGPEAGERPLAGRAAVPLREAFWGAPWRPGRPRRAGRRWPRRRPPRRAVPYISAVSMCVMPRSRPRRRAATAVARSSLRCTRSPGRSPRPRAHGAERTPFHDDPPRSSMRLRPCVRLADAHR